MFNHPIYLRFYEAGDKEKLMAFMETCLPESGRSFDPQGAHKALLNVEDSYEVFLCAFEKGNDRIIGTCAYRPIKEEVCKLKCVYLYKQFHGQGIGTKMCHMILAHAKDRGYKEMYLDTIKETSERAITMYKRLGFVETQQYHETKRADYFMKRRL